MHHCMLNEPFFFVFILLICDPNFLPTKRNRVRGGGLTVLREDGEPFSGPFHTSDFFWNSKIFRSQHPPNITSLGPGLRTRGVLFFGGGASFTLTSPHIKPAGLAPVRPTWSARALSPPQRRFPALVSTSATRSARGCPAGTQK